MPAIDSLRTLLIEQLKDIYDAEKRLTSAIPKLIKAATHDELTTALSDHLAQTKEHVSRVERAFVRLDEPAKTKTCAGMKGLIEEGDEDVGEEYENDGLRDAMIIGAAQRVEHYEIAAYGTAIAHASLLELDDVVSLLEQTLDEEKAADKKLTELAESVVNLDAASEGEEEGEEESAEGQNRSSGRSMSSTPGRTGRGPRATASDRAKSPKRSSGT